MSKNPAFLFYPGDWLTGTMFMSIEEKGAYITLLCVQFEHGEIPEEKILQVITLELWKKIRHKFKKNSRGFFNKRLDFEKEKREKYSKSRSSNRSKISKTHDKHMNNISSTYDQHMGNENENENENKDDNINTVSVNKGKRDKVFEIDCKAEFDKARELYPGSKRGLDTEFDYFKKKIKDWKKVVTLLYPAIEKQIKSRAVKKQKGEFIPEWKGFSSWIYNRYWELEVEIESTVLQVGN